MTQPKQPTNGTGGLRWSTIGKIVGPIVLSIFFACVTLWIKVDRMDHALRSHYKTDQARDSATASDVTDLGEKVHAVELTVAAIQGGE